jgi:Tripartite tricarboxylate transporter family receptor
MGNLLIYSAADNFCIYYPSRPVRIIVGFAPGQAIDIVTRIIGQWLSERLGQQFIIENRPGAGGNIATEAVVRAKRHALRKAELQLYPRYRAGREHLPRVSSHRGESFISGQDGSGVHRLR